MKFLLNINCNNAAFHGDDCEGEQAGKHVPCQCGELRDELGRILRETARRIEDHGLSGFFETIWDSNGNDVGRFAIKPDGYQ